LNKTTDDGELKDLIERCSNRALQMQFERKLWKTTGALLCLFPKLCETAPAVLIPSVTTYLCESGFSNLFSRNLEIVWMYKQICVLLSATYTIRKTQARSRTKGVIELKYISKLLEVNLWFFILFIFQASDYFFWSIFKFLISPFLSTCLILLTY